MKSERHSPQPLDKYLEVHKTRMHKFRGNGFIGNDNLKVIKGKNSYLIYGQISCQGMILLTANKRLRIKQKVRGVDVVQTETYSYNLSIQGCGNILRYDNAHKHAGHPDPHHKHLFDWAKSGTPTCRPIWIGHSEWPLFSEVIEEAESWYELNKAQLHYPDEYSDITTNFQEASSMLLDTK